MHNHNVIHHVILAYDIITMYQMYQNFLPSVHLARLFKGKVKDYSKLNSGRW